MSKRKRHPMQGVDPKSRVWTFNLETAGPSPLAGQVKTYDPAQVRCTFNTGQTPARVVARELLVGYPDTPKNANVRTVANAYIRLEAKLFEMQGAAAHPAPIRMQLECPRCRAQHVDEGVWATRSHKTHECQACGLQWRPANVPTVGVKFLGGNR